MKNHKAEQLLSTRQTSANAVESENIDEQTPFRNLSNDDSGSSAANVTQKENAPTKTVIEIVSSFV